MKISAAILLVLALTANLMAVDRVGPDNTVSNRGAQLKGLSIIGVRLGVGHANESEPDVIYSDYVVTADQNGFYSEIYFNWYFMNELALEIGLAALNRGDFRFNIPGEGNFFGNINVYPIMFGLKVKPFSSFLDEIVQPYIAGGGSIVVGRALIEGGTIYNPYAYINRSIESETSFGWWLSGGFESFIAKNICLTSSFKYQYMDFGEPVGGFSDHTGYQIWFGVGYIFRDK